ncbi:MAG: PBP1A family penicillin-binding protein [Rickettsiales bacterium]|nr:PBP1A family penicillin-binding protein [Rickettsiales bacterium]
MFGKSKSKRKSAPAKKNPRLTSGDNSKKKAGPSRVSPKGNANYRVRGKGGSRHKRRSIWRKAFHVGSSLAFTGAIMVLIAVLYFAHDLPSIDKLNTIDKQPGITIKTKDGLVLATYGDIYGEYVTFDEIPQSLIHAVLATEDRRFFEHIGIDFFGIARAMVANIQAGGFVQGGSTITQQVAKNVFLTPDRTITRKIQEMLLAFWLEERFTKEEIFAIYVNRVYLGAGNFGIDAASRRYFEKPAIDLEIMESAILAGLLKAPSKYSPMASPERAKQRGHQVLLNMVDAGYLHESKVTPILETFAPPRTYSGDGSGSRYFTDWILDELPEYVGAVEEDLEVITTLDPDMQMKAEETVKKVIAESQEKRDVSQAALLSMSSDGAIRAMVGGVDYQESQFNRAVQAKRQPGSVFKLFVYLAALDAGLSPDTLIPDEPLEIPVGRKIWRPKNFDGQYRGEITMREGLTHSINTISVQLIMAIGVDRVVEMARRLRINEIIATPSIALGAVEANLIDLTAAYAHLANNGKGVEPYGIEAIYSQGGDALYRRSGSGLWVVLRQKVVTQMNSMLNDVISFGTGRGANIGRSMAGKTGTSSDYKDAWFIGYTPQLVTGVWVGNDDNHAMKRVTGGSVPAIIWRDYMSAALSGKSAPALPVESDDDGELPWLSDAEEPDSLGEFIQRKETGEDGHGYKKSKESKSFWDNIFSGDGNAEVEYEYPNSSPRERGLRR